MTAGEPVVRARGVAVARAGVEVVRDVDLALTAGEVVVLIGPNGAGKSTLLAALAGLLPATRGTVERRGRVAAALQAPALAQRTARANVEAALAWWGVARRERRDRALAALHAMGARASPTARPARSPAARRAASTSPARSRWSADALLLDEPFAGLDAPTRAELLYDAASALRDARRATLVVVHDRAEAWALRRPGARDARRPRRGGRAAGRGLRVAADAGGRRVRRLRRAPGGAGTPFASCARRTSALDPDGPLRARVTRLVPVEDGVRVELALAHGRLVALAPAPARAGAEVGVRLLGGVSFPR